MANNHWVKRAAKEPVIQFFLIAAVLFLVYFLTTPALQDQEVITINPAVLTHLKQTKTNQDDYIRDEAMYRAALAMGLDKNDFVIKRRLIQKLSFLLEDLNTENLQPTTEQLQHYFEQNKQAYQLQEKITFKQLYFSSDKHDGKAEQVARTALTNLQQNGKKIIADRTSLKTDYADETVSSVMFKFGRQFSKAIFQLTPAEHWQGPIESGYGYHLVKVTHKTLAEQQNFEMVQDKVRQNYIYEQLKKRNKHSIDKIVQQYKINREASS